MNIHEYQARDILSEYGLPIPKGKLILKPEDAEDASVPLPCVLKAQVHTGGRKKAGGVRACETREELKKTVSEMLGMQLVTNQTGPKGKTVRKLLAAETVDILQEYYLAVTWDNEAAEPVFVLSKEGGIEIEVTARENPEKIVKVLVSLEEGLREEQCASAAEALELVDEQKEELRKIMQSLLRLFLEKDCTLAEINPLVKAADGHLLCLDAKFNFDDNALFRHPEIRDLKDPFEEDSKELKAAEYDLSYISLDGDIGCLVNGAGLAMATMDMIKARGGSPANFLDVGGSATKEKVRAAFEILLSDTQVKAVFVNIFGGIMKCDIIAEGITEAAKEMGLKVPLIVRLEGTNVEEGRRILSESGLALISATDMADGAEKAVAAARRYEEIAACEYGTGDAEQDEKAAEGRPEP